jgi:hypothetical protein
VTTAVTGTNEEEEEEEPPGAAAPAVPSTGDAMAAIETWRRFLYAAPSNDTAQE